MIDHGLTKNLLDLSDSSLRTINKKALHCSNSLSYYALFGGEYPPFHCRLNDISKYQEPALIASNLRSGA